MKVDLDKEITDRKGEIIRLKKEIEKIEEVKALVDGGIDMGSEPEEDQDE